MNPRKTCPPDHAHGTTSNCYNTHKCRCATCVTARADYQRTVRRQKAYGRFDNGLTDLQPVLDRIQTLRDFGLGRTRIADLAGIRRSTMMTILYESRGHITKTNAAAILAVEPRFEYLADGAYVNPRGTRRRIEALVARGWSYYALAHRLGLNNRSIQHIHDDSSKVIAGTHRRIAALYDELWNQQPPTSTPHQKAAYSRSINRARANGWAPPAAWDDIDTDEAPPKAEHSHEVDWVAVDLVIHGENLPLHRLERHEVVKHFHALRWSDGRIADLVGADDRTILRDREELGLEAFDQTELLRRDAA